MQVCSQSNGTHVRISVIDNGIGIPVEHCERVFNLFDSDYAEATYGDEQWILGRPRSFDVSVRASF